MSEDTGLTEYIDTDQLAIDNVIDRSDLTGAMQKHSGLYVHYAVQAVRARGQYERWKNAQEILEARLDGEHRTKLADEGKKVTEAQIKAAILQDPRYITCANRLIQAQQIMKFAEIGERSFDGRKDLLLQMARDAAREAEGQLRLVLSGAGDTAAKSARDSLVERLQEQKVRAAA